jgi:hypothetical protein
MYSSALVVSRVGRHHHHLEAPSVSRAVRSVYSPGCPVRGRLVRTPPHHQATCPPAHA